MVGLEYEFILHEKLTALGIPFKSEEDLRREGSHKTPDVLLSVPLRLCSLPFLLHHPCGLTKLSLLCVVSAPIHSLSLFCVGMCSGVQCGQLCPHVNMSEGEERKPAFVCTWRLYLFWLCVCAYVYDFCACVCVLVCVRVRIYIYVCVWSNVGCDMVHFHPPQIAGIEWYTGSTARRPLGMSSPLDRARTSCFPM